MERHPTIVCATCPKFRAFSEKQKERGCHGGQCHKHYQHVEFSEDVCCTDHPEWNREDAQNDKQTIAAQSDQISKQGKRTAELEEERDRFKLSLEILEIESSLKKCDCCGYPRIFFYLAHKGDSTECAWCKEEKAKLRAEAAEAELAELKEAASLDAAQKFLFREFAMEAESDLDVIQAAWCDFDAIVEKQGARIAELEAENVKLREACEEKRR